MTAADHLNTAENLISQVSGKDTAAFQDDARFLILWALAHSVMALAIELGVPHPAAAGG